MTVFLAGQTLLAATLEDWQPRWIQKAALTGRGSTVSPTADPDLAVSLVAGTWTFVLNGYTSSVANAAGDIRVRMAWTGTATVDYYGHGLVTALASGGSGGLIASPGARGDTTSPGTEFLAGCSTAGQLLRITGSITATTSTTLTVEWAQRASDANNTRMLEGSWLEARRVV
jgi:hypothetical protein